MTWGTIAGRIRYSQAKNKKGNWKLQTESKKTNGGVPSGWVFRLFARKNSLDDSRK